MKTRDKISVCLNIVIAVLVVGYTVWMMAGIEGPLADRGAAALKFFTVDSNILMGITAVIAAVLKIKRKGELPRWALALYLVAAASVMLTFLVVALILAPFVPTGYFSLFLKYNFFFHFFVPVLGAVDFIFFEDGRRLRFRACFLALIPVVLYAIYYIVPLMVTAAPDGTVNAARDWYMFFRLGTKMLVPVVLIVGGLDFVGAVLLRLFSRLRAAATAKREAE